MCIYTGVRKFGPFILQNQKIRERVIHILSFFLKRGGYRISEGAEKGAIRHAHPYYVIYRELDQYCQTVW